MSKFLNLFKHRATAFMLAILALANIALLAVAPAPAEAALSFNTATRTARCQAVVTAAGASAVLEVRSGTKPATTPGAGALPAATGTLLATITFGSTIGTCTSGALDWDEAGATQSNGSHVAGTPGYARLKTSGGTAIFDIDVCGSAPCWTFTGSVATGQNVTLTALLFTEGNT